MEEDPEDHVEQPFFKNNIYRFSALALMLAFVVTCTSDKKPAPIKKSTDTGTPPNQEVGGGDQSSLEAIIKACGVDPKVYADPNGVLFEQNFAGLQKKISGTKLIIVNYSVTVQPFLSVKTTNAVSTQNTDIKVLEATPAIAASQAEKEIAPMRGVTSSTGLTQAELTDLKSKNSEWSTILCIASPTVESTAPSGLKLRFDPGMPGSISPLAQPDVYAKEIGEGKDFNIKVKVEAPGSSGLQAGQEFAGRVSIKKINPSLNIDDQVSGKTSTIQADIAYKVSADFGGVEQTKKLGITQEKYFYISHQQKRFLAIVAVQGNPQYDPVVFLPQ